MHRDACCSTIACYSLYNINRWQIEVVQHSFYKITIIGSLVSCPSSLQEVVQARMQGIRLFFFLAITVSALFVHYRWKINSSADIMAAFHTQKRLGGVFITTLPFKNILWSNHISSTTLPCRGGSRLIERGGQK